jgi:hypothetical protein
LEALIILSAFFMLFKADKVKVILSLRLINETPRHEDVLGSGSLAPPFLTSSLYGCEWLGLRPCRFIPGVIATGTHYMGGWMGPRTGLNTVEKIKCLVPAGNRTPAFQPHPVAIPISLKQITES